MQRVLAISVYLINIAVFVVANSAHAKDKLSEYSFGRLFPQLEGGLVADEVLMQLGRPSDDTESPAYMEDSQVRGTDNNAEIEVGQTYTGQLVVHDISKDSTSVIGETIDPEDIPNDATPWLDLDTIYNFDGVVALKDPNDPAKLLLGNSIGNERDFPRDSDGRALIADRRNDENTNLAQLTPVLMQFHNTMVDELRDEGKTSESRIFFKAKALTVSHWQAIVLYDFLPNFIEPSLIDDILKNGGRFYTKKMAKKGMIPVEFAMAANRFGHSIARGRYTLNSAFDRVRMFPLSEEELDRNLMGDVAIPPERQIGWPRYFKINDSEPGDINDPVDQFSGLQVGRIVDRLLARPLLRLPVGGPGLPNFFLDEKNTVAGMPTVSLAALSLLRAKATGVPSGHDVALAMGVEPLQNVQFDICDPGEYAENCEIFLSTPMEAPLFIYITEEARIQNSGAKLGDVGGRIVAEVILGLLKHGKRSILKKKFVSHISGTNRFSMAEMITHIGWETTPFDEGIELGSN